MACCACTFGVETHFSHWYAQFGCFACADSIHVSAHPVAPSFGIRSATGAFAALSVFVWYGHDAPITASPFLSRLTAALNWAEFSSYGSLIPSEGCDLDRKSAASAIWIGLSGTVTLPLYAEE